MVKTSIILYICFNLSESTEAMYLKVPVIVGSNVGAKDIIKDEENGFIFQAYKYSGKDLAGKISNLINNYDKLPPIIEKSYQTAKNCTWDKFAKDLFKSCFPEIVLDNKVLANSEII